MEKPLRVWPAAIAGGAVSGVLYLICAFFVWINSELTINLFGTWFHGVDLTKIEATFNPDGLFLGLITIMTASVITVALFVWLYNACYNHCKRRGWID